MLLRTRNLIIKEFIQFGRDRFFALFILLFPTLQLILIANATGQGWDHLPAAVWDQDRTELSRRLTTALDVTQELDVVFYPQNLEEANALLATGKATVVVIIPTGFARDLLGPGAAPAVQVTIDGANNLIAGVALTASEGAINDFARRLMEEGGSSRAAPIEVQSTVRFNQTLNIQHQAIPAQVGLIVYQVTLAVAAISLARERELGTLEQLAVTPLRRFELITGKAMPAAALGLFDFLVLLGVMIYGFGVPMRGSWPLLLLATFIFIAAEIGWGMLISALSHTQQQAILIVFIVAMTDVSLSGYMVAVKNMPSLLRALSFGSAIRHYLTILRVIMLKGAGLETIWPELAALAGIAIIVGALALAALRQRLD